MARTDAIATEGLNAAVDRCAVYIEAGADMIFAEAVTELSMYRKFKETLGVPILANLTEFGHTPCTRKTNSRPRARTLSCIAVQPTEP
jgi:methylisocitrate lyase